MEGSEWAPHSTTLLRIRSDWCAKVPRHEGQHCSGKVPELEKDFQNLQVHPLPPDQDYLRTITKMEIGLVIEETFISYEPPNR